MALSRARKAEIVGSYEEQLPAAQHAFLVSYKGVTVPQVTDLRARIRQKGGHYLVVKNTLALRAIQGGALASLSEHFSGPTAVAWSEDPVAIAKVLTDFVKEVPALEFKAALVEGRSVQAAEIQQIAQLPSREQLIAKLLYLLQSPITRLARVLAGVPQQFVSVLDQIRTQKEQA